MTKKFKKSLLELRLFCRVMGRRKWLTTATALRSAGHLKNVQPGTAAD